MAEGVRTLEQNIEKFEKLLVEMKHATREAHSALKQLQHERKEIEKYFVVETQKLIQEHVTEVVKTELDVLAPQIRAQTSLIYSKVGEQIDILINLGLGKQYSKKAGKEDLRPMLAEKLREWIREIIAEEEAKNG